MKLLANCANASGSARSSATGGHLKIRAALKLPSRPSARQAGRVPRAVERLSSVIRTEQEHKPSLPSDYKLPDVWEPSDDMSGCLSNFSAGARFTKALRKGQHDLQLYSLGTANGQKVTILLEELIEAGLLSDYDAWLVDISQSEQYSSGFVEANPNSKIPVLVDHAHEAPLPVNESGHILAYLSEKFGGAFVPKDFAAKTACFNWVYWQVGSAPSLAKFGHFYKYAPTVVGYAVDLHTR